MKKKMTAFILTLLFILPSFSKKHLALAEASEDLPADAPYGEHIRLITDVGVVPMQIEVYDEATGRYTSKTVPGSDYIPVGSGDYVQIVCGYPPYSYDIRGGEFYIYFYDHDKNVIRDILDHIDERTGERNRVSVNDLKELNGFQFTDIPDGSYIRIAKANDHACQLLIWDGCKTGYPITGLTTVFNDDFERERLPEDSSACIQVPKTALYLIAKPGYTFMNTVTSNTEINQHISYPESRFPAQFINLRGFGGAGRAKNVRIVKDYDYKTGAYAKIMPNVDLSDAIVAVDENGYQATVPASALINPIYSRIQACMDFTWEAKRDVIDKWGEGGHSGSVGYFHEGITYHGIPYRSSWSVPTSVGWHVSKQTFMNAANDPDSVFYHNKHKKKVGPYYSLVCSSFGALVTGFAYPMTNFSMMHDPRNQIEKTDAPILGSLMTNGTGHCFIPLELSTSPSGFSVLTLAEQIGPITTVRNVYPEISKSWQGIGLHSAFPDRYVYCVTPPSFSDIPYNITDYTIKNGSARPYLGDQSVYTSAMNVLINIKDLTATRLYFQKFDVTCSHGLPLSATPSGKPYYAPIKPGTKQVILRSATGEDGSFTGAALENGAIYGVWASRDDQQTTAPANVEFFEWYDLAKEKVQYTVKDGALVTDDVFWYSISLASSEKDGKSGTFSIPYQSPVPNAEDGSSHSDYTNYAEQAQLSSVNAVKAFFRKGQFGAYNTAREVLDD